MEGAASPECAWVGSNVDHLPNLPDLPQLVDLDPLEIQLPPILPRLIPSWRQLLLTSFREVTTPTARSDPHLGLDGAQVHAALADGSAPRGADDARSVVWREVPAAVGGALGAVAFAVVAAAAAGWGGGRAASARRAGRGDGCEEHVR